MQVCKECVPAFGSALWYLFLALSLQRGTHTVDKSFPRLLGMKTVSVVRATNRQKTRRIRVVLLVNGDALSHGQTGSRQQPMLNSLNGTCKPLQRLQSRVLGLRRRKQHSLGRTVDRITRRPPHNSTLMHSPKQVHLWTFLSSAVSSSACAYLLP